VFLFYSIIGICSTWAGLKGKGGRKDSAWIVWVVIGFSLVAMGLSRVAGAQVVVTDAGRMAARGLGVYGRRLVFEPAFVAAVVTLTIAAGAAAAFALKGLGAEVVGATVGFGALLCVLALKVSSFHDVDTLMSRELGGISFGRLLEMTCLAGIGVCMLVWWLRQVCAGRWARSPGLSSWSADREGGEAS